MGRVTGLLVRTFARPTAAGLLALASIVASPPQLGAQGYGVEMAPSGSSERLWSSGHLLRICADPDNLPFSDRALAGFDNRIAALLAAELGDSVTYLWWPARRGFVRNTLRARDCDVLLGVPGGFDPVLETRPYYRSAYSLVYDSTRAPGLRSLDDPRMRTLRVGVNLIGEDYTHTPPLHALLRRGISSNVTGFSTFYGEEHHPGEIIDSLAHGAIDVAVVWGPLAGYFARRTALPLAIVPLPDDSLSGLPFAFDIGIGVRRADRDLRARLDSILDRRHDDIARILGEYGVPTVARVATTTAPSSGTPSSGASSGTARSSGATVATPAATTRAVLTPTAAVKPPKAPARDSTARRAAADSLLVTRIEYQGWKTFAVNCTRCHGEDAIGSTIAPNLMKSLRTTVTHPVFVQTVTEGRLAKGMPVWGALLTPEQIENVYAYLKARSEGRLAAGRPHVKPDA